MRIGQIRTFGFVASVALVMATGCDRGAAKVDTSKIEKAVADNGEKLDKLLSKIDALEGEVKKAAKAGADKPARKQAGRPDPDATYKVEVGEANSKGPKDALVTIVEWSDFQCPFCSRVNPTIDTLMKDYDGKLRVAFKHNPLGFHKRAMPAAIAAEAAGRQGKFWEMHDKLFANGRNLTDENFEKWAKELKLDVKKFKADMEDESIAKAVTEMQRQGAQLGARGTPAFFINGRFLSGAQPVANFKKIIDEELKKAEKLVASGVPKDQVYAKTIAKGKTKV